MKLAKITQIIEKISFDISRNKIYSCKIPIYFNFNKIMILDIVYGGVSMKYSYESQMLELDLFGLPDFFQNIFISHIEKKGLFVLFYNDSKIDFSNLASYLIDEVIHDRHSLIFGLLRKKNVLMEGERTPLENEALTHVNQNLTIQEREELKGVFSVDFEINIKGVKNANSISIHAKNNIDYDHIKESDFYLRVHSEGIDYPFILILEGQPYTIQEAKISYSLPMPSESFFRKYGFVEEEILRYKELCEIFDIFTCNYFDIPEEESSELGGYPQRELSDWEQDKEDFNDVEEWVQLLSLSSYSHWTDFFNEIGDGIMNVLVKKSSLGEDDIITKFIMS